ncbi:hypothetical protein H6P81_018741 [Aristolochia fimbriata]|uniref:Mei2-like C-terminal RNA recognition motif domain-containing protein n=1 Tax=Aristolochia fimbriata TaxID=158543 RepID=A0AAV7E610_ARIFI|nr:hypothetical protein H6P81_018741 [Aristolochia fimbriata]
MAKLNPLALEFRPYHGAIPSSFLLQFAYPECFYPPPPPPAPPLTDLLPNYPFLFSGAVESPPLYPTTPLSVSNNTLHLYLGFPSSPIKPDLGYSYCSEFPFPVEEVGNLAEDVLESSRKSETKAGKGGNRSRRRKMDPSTLKALWVAKGRAGKVDTESKSPPEAVQVLGENTSTNTTVMIRNIPNKFTRKMLLDFLDRHCREENGRSLDTHDEAASAFDFVYLPMDFASGCNLGYAFVNFTNGAATAKLRRVLHRKRWGVLGSKKICEIGFAKIQGVEALRRHFEKSLFACESDEYLPVRFNPFRDGVSPFESRVVGTRVPRVPLLPD